MSQVEKILADPVKLRRIAEAAFNTVDTDENGFLDIDELAEVMDMVASNLNLPQPSENEVEDVLGKLDANKDGKLSLDEFEVHIKNVFEMMRRREVNVFVE
jgi:Ca2+-binding EF-hand superfamily protein